MIVACHPERSEGSLIIGDEHREIRSLDVSLALNMTDGL
jgi:hypothetical protein